MEQLVFVYETFWPVNEVLVLITYARNHFIHMQSDLKYKLSHHLPYFACVDPECFVRRVPTLTTFLVDEGREDLHITIRGPSSARQRNAI